MRENIIASKFKFAWQAFLRGAKSVLWDKFIAQIKLLAKIYKERKCKNSKKD